MKQLKVIFSMVIVIFCFTAVNAQTVKTKTKSKTAVADTLVYQCPMNCEGDKTYDKAGKCPKCNMNLKATAKPAPAAYQCPMKCEGDKTYSKEGKCPVCNMKLSKVEKKQKKDHDGHNHN